MDKKINAILVSLITIGAVAIYFTSVIDALMIILLLLMLFVGAIFSFLSHTTEAKKKYNPLFRMGVSTVGFFLISCAALSYAEFYQGFVYPYSFIPFILGVFAFCLLLALSITFCSYQFDDEKEQR